MIKVSLSQDSMFQMAVNAMAITHAQTKKIQQRFMNAARAAESHAIEMARTKLDRTAQQYADALSFQKVSENIAELRLDGSASHIENGYPSFDMIPGMMRSQAIVKVGKRAGQPWVRTSKAGYRYAIVPFVQSTKSAQPGSRGHDWRVQIGQPTETTQGSLSQDMERLLKAFGVSRRRRGEPSEGKAWTLKQGAGDLWSMMDAAGRITEKDVPGINPLLGGLTKTNAPVGQTTRGQYNTFRVATENPNRKSRWRHPGYGGVHIFKDLESWMRSELEKIVRTTLGGQ